MEQLVLGIFQEQLSKIIVGFRKEQVNANLLNGKGEITDVSLNCSLLNETISKITPFIEFEEIHVSRLGFHVTSWANLRKAPIVVDIGVITATIHEPLHCLPRAQRKRIRMITEKTLANMIMQGLFTPRKGSYGFADRIQDNLKIEIEKFRINFQTWGKFKTRRVGPWTPPLLQIDFDNMTIVSVDENGHEGTPDEVWAHNRHQHEIFMLYKKITLENSVSIISNNPDQQTAELLHRTSVEVQAAVKRRLRDGAVLGVQSDVTIPNVEVDIEPNFLPLMAQLAAGFQYCFAKDKSFEDPLKPRSENDVKPTSTSDHKPVIRSMSKDSADMEEELEVSEDEEDDDEIDTAEIDNASVSSSSANDINEIHIAVEENPMKQTSSHGAPLDGTNGDRPLIFLPIGLVIYEKICVTASIHHAIVRSSYTEDQNGCIQFSTKGCIAEFIWPKENKEFGMHAQLSVSFLSLQELYNQRTRTILIGGMRHEDHPSLDRPSQKPREVNLDENFPLFERRSIREDPLDLRHSFPSQAFGLKTTIEFRKSETGDDVMISHEMGVDEVDLVLDSNVCCRASRFVLNENGEGLDARWHSGDWTDELTVDMLQRPSKTLDLDDYLQETKEIFLDDNFMISSDLFNVTARLTNVELRVPAAVEENVRSCDILVELKETTFVVSSALPRTFLSGKIGSSVNGDDLEKKGIIDFPNDQSDIAYSLEKEEDPSLRQQGVATSRNISTFRAQLTLRGFQMRFVPVIPFCNAPAPQQFIAPADLAMLVCFEGEPPEPGSTYIQVALFITIQIHRLLLNVDLDLLAGATSTLLHHAGTVEATLERVNNIISSNPSPSDGDSNFDTSKVEKSLHGRRLMVKRHLSQSRETGGLAIVFCLQQAELGITIWRQNVPLVSPFRYSVAEESSSYRIQNDRHLKVLQLMHLNMKDFEIGVEFDFHANESRRTILKCCLEKANIKTCDFDKEMESQNFECQSAACDTDEPNNRLHQSRMVDVLSFGIDQLPGNLSASYSGQEKHFALRLEEQLKETRSWSLAADLTSPAIISLHVDEIKDAALLLIEALLLPTWSKRATSTGENAPFPDGSIGALFCSLVADVEESTKNVELKWDAVPENGQEPSEAFVERALRAIFKFFLPEDLRLVLLRLEVANLLVCIPVEPSLQEQNNKKLGLLLNRSDIIVRFYPVLGSQPTTLEDVLACKGVAWSSLIQTREEGYYQNISSQQSLVSIFSKENVTETDLLVHPFDIGLSYAAGEVKLAMKNDLMISDIRKIEIFIGRIINLGDRCEDHYSVMSNILQAIQKSTSAESEKVLSTIGEKAKTQLTTSNERVPGNLIQSTRAFVQRVHEELGLYEKQLRNVLSKKDAENESLKIQVFEKEKERFGALALLSSRVAGWIRIGGFHRTGQRVSRKSTMWPYWAVLRKDLLMLYTNPGEPKPADVVLLAGAKIHQLAGGRSTQDIKRGFAIIESAGITRYFVTSTAQEYTLWTREISSVLGSYERILVPNNAEPGGDSSLRADNNITRVSTFDSSDSLDSPVRDIASANSDRGESGIIRRIALGDKLAATKNRIGATKNKIGSAIKTARQNRRLNSAGNMELETDISEHGHNPDSANEDLLDFNYTKIDCDDDLVATLLEKKETDTDVAQDIFSSAAVGAGSDVGKTDVNSGGGGGVDAVAPRRRLQFGQNAIGSRIGSAGSRIGSAIQNVRQKGLDTPEQAEQRPLAGLRGKFRSLRGGGDTVGDGDGSVHANSNSLHGISQNSSPWTCEKCTFINNSKMLPVPQTSCELCGSERIVGNQLATNDTPDSAEPLSKNTLPSSSHQPLSTGQDAGADSAQTNLESSRLGRLGSFGTAVARSARMKLGQRSSMNSNESIFEGGAITLKNVHASGHPPSVSGVDAILVPLKKFVGLWTVSVKPGRLTLGTNPQTVNDSGGMLKVKMANEEEKSSFGAMNSTESTTGPEKLHRVDSGVNGNSSVPNIQLDTESIDDKEQDQKEIFRFGVFRADQVEMKPAIERIFSLGDVLQLHAQISESLERMLPQLINEEVQAEKSGSRATGQGSQKLTTLFSVEKVMVTGRILGGLLDLEESSDITAKTRSYHVCPLPAEALASISEFLGILSSTIYVNAISEQSLGVQPKTDSEDPLDQSCAVEGAGKQVNHKERGIDADLEKSNSEQKASSRSTELSNHHPGTIFSLLSVFETELLRAQKANLIVSPTKIAKDNAERKTSKSTSANRPIIKSEVYEPLLPPSVADNFHEAMHEALVNVMAERDEAHAQLIAANVLHIHQLEQAKRKNERLRIELKVAEELKEVQVQLPNVVQFFGGKFENNAQKERQKALEEKIEGFERILGKNQDDEINALCHQLNGEISAKTSHALEIIRLKETREIERKNELAEKQALKEELRRVKELLAAERRKI